MFIPRISEVRDKAGLRRQLTVRRFGYVSRLGTSVTGMPVTDFAPLSGIV